MGRAVHARLLALLIPVSDTRAAPDVVLPAALRVAAASTAPVAELGQRLLHCMLPLLLL